MFAICPSVNPEARILFNEITTSEFGKKYLFTIFSKFYTDVESTGANSEFYDKFNIRRLIQVIFKSMWEDPIHRTSFSNVAM